MFVFGALPIKKKENLVLSVDFERTAGCCSLLLFSDDKLQAAEAAPVF